MNISKRLVLSGSAVAVAVLAAACGGDQAAVDAAAAAQQQAEAALSSLDETIDSLSESIEASVSSALESVDASIEASTESVFNLGVGDCFLEPDGMNVTDLVVVPCDQAHTGEVFFNGIVPDSASLTNVQGTVVEPQCLPAFEAYVGTPYETSEFAVAWFEPTTDGFAQGDNVVNCYISLTVPEPGSAAGSGR